MKDYVPLMQTVIWALLILTVILLFGPEIKEVTSHAPC
jgi:hypothetical protein